MAVQLIIDGQDFTNYVVDSLRELSICNPIGRMSITLSPNLPRDIQPYEQMEFYENGTKVFTGYTYTFAKGRLPVKKEITCYDPLILARDYWFIGPHISNGEQAIAWIGRFLRMAGITNWGYNVREGASIFPGYGWDHTSCLEAIFGILKMTPYQIYADSDGKVWVVQISRNTPADYSIDEYIEYSRSINDSYIRNRIVVFGNGFSAVRYGGDNPYLLPGEVRTAAVGTGQIHLPATAYALADKMLAEFANPLDVKVVEVVANPNYWIGQIIDFHDRHTGYHKTNCVLTSLTATYDADGYTMELTLDEKCRHFWGWDTEPTYLPYLFCSTLGGGVWRSPWDGYSVQWSEINNGLSGNAKTVYDMKMAADQDMLWVATAGGLYLTENSGDLWVGKTMPEPTPGHGPPTPYALAPDPTNKNILYVLCKTVDPYTSEDVPWIAKTDNKGSTWTYKQITPEYAWETGVWGVSSKGNRFATFLGNLYTSRAKERQLGVWVDQPSNPNLSATLGYCVCTGDIGVWCTPSANKRPQIWTGSTWIEADESYFRHLLPGGSGQRDPNGDICSHNGYIWILSSSFSGSPITYSITQYTQNGTFVENGYHICSNWTGDTNLGYTQAYHLHSFGGNLFMQAGPNRVLRFVNFTDVPGAIWGETYANWIEETNAAVDRAGGFITHNNTLYLAHASTTLLKRVGGSWVNDSIICPDTIRCGVSADGVLYVGAGSKVYKRTATQYVEICDISNVVSEMTVTRIAYHDNHLYVHCLPYGLIFKVCPTGGYLELYDTGQTHTMAITPSGKEIYATLKDRDMPRLVITSDTLSAITTQAKNGIPGGWAGVAIDRFNPQGVWTFGNWSNLAKVAYSNYFGDSWEIISSGLPQSSTVRSFIQGFFGDDVALLDGEAWGYNQDAESWEKRANLPFDVNCGAEDFSGGVFAGAMSGGTNVLQRSNLTGQLWDELSAGLTHSYRITSVVVGEYDIEDGT